MKFKDVELLPGVVVLADDPKNLQRIKVSVPGLFDNSVMNIEGMPWIYPLTMSGFQGYSKLREGSKVWIFKIENNYRELWYIPMFEAREDTRQIIGENQEADILISRSIGDNYVQVYYSEADGVAIKLGDSQVFNLNPSGDITLKSGNANITFSANKISIGQESADQAAVKGNELSNLLSRLASDLSNLATIASSNPYTAPLSSPLTTMSTNISNQLNNILSSDVQLS